VLHPDNSYSAEDLARNYKGLPVLGRAAEVPERVYLHAIQQTRVGKREKRGEEELYCERGRERKSDKKNAE
jgi:hypothetical protein